MKITTGMIFAALAGLGFVAMLTLAGHLITIKEPWLEFQVTNVPANTSVDLVGQDGKSITYFRVKNGPGEPIVSEDRPRAYTPAIKDGTTLMIRAGGPARKYSIPPSVQLTIYIGSEIVLGDGSNPCVTLNNPEEECLAELPN